uniref:Ribosomal RNA small subunit methyltransferase H n=1 Tax=Anthurium amnicola TaxID=1678845 RepID=A0A1D1YZU6_9ARAE
MHKMSDGEVRKVSRQDIQLVQNLIERCLQLYMNQKEVVETLELNARIEPGFTELVWQKLEEENREFFEAYHVRLMLKNQINIFNQLLQKQVELMHGIHPAGAVSVSLHGDSNASLQQTLSCYTSTPSRPDNMPCPLAPSSSLVNGGPPSLQGIAITDANSLHVERISLPTSLLSTQSSQMAMLHGMNGTTIKMEPTYSSNSEFTFCTDNSFSEGRSATGDAPLQSFSSTELNAQPLNEPFLDIDASSFGILSQIPRNFSFSDLTEDFTQSTDILESYGRSPFLGPESNLSTSTGREGERKI